MGSWLTMGCGDAGVMEEDGEEDFFALLRAVMAKITQKLMLTTLKSSPLVRCWAVRHCEGSAEE